MTWRREPCRSCGAAIIWARTVFNGTPIPVNADPVDHGNILLMEDHDSHRLTALVLPPGDERITTQTTYSAHFVTCPDGDKWRRRTHA